MFTSNFSSEGTPPSDDVTVLQAETGTSLTVPGGAWLLQADFSPQGPDLLLTGADGAKVLVRDFFTLDPPPDLATEGGAEISAELAAKLAGPAAPGQFALLQNGPFAELAQITESAIGKVEATDGLVEAIRVDGNRVALSKGDDIYEGDTIETGAGAAVGITFADDTTFSLGGDGRMVMDEMVYDPSTNGGAFSANVVQGVFSFVSGQVAKTAPDAMMITTPVATIGIRGTKVAGRAAQEGEQNTISLLPEIDLEGNTIVGELTVTNQGGTVTLNAVGATVQLTSALLPPPPPKILSTQQLDQQYGEALNVLPSPPEGNSDGNDDTEEAAGKNVEGEGEAAPDGEAGQDEENAENGGEAPLPGSIDEAMAMGFDMGLNILLQEGARGEMASDIMDEAFESFMDNGAKFGIQSPLNVVSKIATDIAENFTQNVVIDPETTITHTMTGGVASITATNGYTDQIIGSGTGDTVTVYGLNPAADADMYVLVNGAPGQNNTVTLANNNSTESFTIYQNASATGTVTLNLGDGGINVGQTISTGQVASTALRAVTINGGTGIDTILGGAGGDTLSGNANADTLKGNGGDDTLTGGAGADALTGGTGSDTFCYNNGDSATTGYDTISDFSAPDGDIIDVSAMTQITEAEIDAASITNIGASGYADLSTALSTAAFRTTYLDTAGETTFFSTNDGNTYMLIESGDNTSVFNDGEDFIVAFGGSSDFTGFADASIVGA